MAVLVRGGTVVNADRSFRADVLCADGKIVAVGEGLDAPTGAEIVDAGGSYVIPGGIDPHTLERVAAVLDGSPAPLSAEEVGDRAGLSRVTAWRYLEHLVRAGRATLDHQYGLAGRPAKLYRARREG